MTSKSRLLSSVVNKSESLIGASLSNPNDVNLQALETAATQYTDVTTLPASGYIGEQAFVASTNRLYIWTGTGWFNIALVNTDPTISSAGNANYTMSYGTPITVDVDASDPEGLGLSYSYYTSDSIGNIATITNDSSQFTITPSSDYSVEGSFGLVFRASDGPNIASSSTSTFTLTNQSPSLSGNSSSYVLATDGSTPTVITLTSVDPEGQPITYTATGDSGFNAIATVSNDSSVFTITPKSEDSAVSGTGSLTFTASDGVKSTNAASSFTLSFISWGSVTQQAKIQASDAEAGDYFGISVSISGDGDTAIVGAYNEDTGGTNAGSAYIFTRSGTTWSQQAKIQASDADNVDYFGKEVSISGDGDTVIVGAYSEDTGGTDAGSAYIFTRSGTTWSQQAKIQASDAEAGDSFGYSVDISEDGDTVIVGAVYEDTGGFSAGSAYIFTRSGATWSQQAKIQASDTEAFDWFGHTVSISGDGDTVIVGAIYEDTTVSNAGSAYIFTRSGTTWSQQAKIQASDAEDNDNFGATSSISSDGNTAIVGAYNEDTGGSSAGSAYIFTRSGTTWSQQAKIQASDAEASDYFGKEVSISGDGDTAIIGAYLADTTVTDEGSAYIFTRSGTTWSQQAKIQASDAEASDNFGQAVSISGDGDTAIVGAVGEDTGGASAGAAYIFVPA